MIDFEITGMTRNDKRRADRFGAVVLAYFTVTIRGIKINGCTLKRERNGDLGVGGPAMPDASDCKRSIKIIDKELRDNLANEAVGMFKAIGGTEADLVGLPNVGPRRGVMPDTRTDDADGMDYGTDGWPRVRYFDT